LLTARFFCYFGNGKGTAFPSGGDTANIKQNTTNAGFFIGRRVARLLAFSGTRSANAALVELSEIDRVEAAPEGALKHRWISAILISRGDWYNSRAYFEPMIGTVFVRTLHVIVSGSG
jgi:hypothetical protein